MVDPRYKELKQENDQTCTTLSDSYQRVALAYIKKARGYAVKNSDTEIKIKETLSILEDYDTRRVPYNIAIPDVTGFIEPQIKLLSKQVKDVDKVKSIIAVGIFILAIALWAGISIWSKKETLLETPINLQTTITEDGIKLFWDAVEFADEGYITYYVDSNGRESARYKTMNLYYEYNIDTDKTYTFYVCAIKTDILGQSKAAVYDYTPA